MTLRELLDMLPIGMLDLEIKIKIGNQYIDTDSVDVKDESIVIYIDSWLFLKIPYFSLLFP